MNCSEAAGKPVSPAVLLFHVSPSAKSVKLFALVVCGVRLAFSSFVYFVKVKLQDFGDFYIYIYILHDHPL
jgi:hypothetical protein